MRRRKVFTIPADVAEPRMIAEGKPLTREIDRLLLNAVLLKSWHQVTTCLAHGANPNLAYPKSHVSVLMNAITCSAPPHIIRLFLDSGARPNDYRENGWYPIHYAACQNVSEHKGEVISALVEAGALVNMKGPQGSTPLHLAASFGAYADLVTLLRYGADPNVLSEVNLSPMMNIIDASRPSCFAVALIILGGAELDIPHGSRTLLGEALKKDGCEADLFRPNGPFDFYKTDGVMLQENPKARDDESSVGHNDTNGKNEIGAKDHCEDNEEDKEKGNLGEASECSLARFDHTFFRFAREFDREMFTWYNLSEGTVRRREKRGGVKTRLRHSFQASEPPLGKWACINCNITRQDQFWGTCKKCQAHLCASCMEASKHCFQFNMDIPVHEQFLGVYFESVLKSAKIPIQDNPSDVLVYLDAIGSSPQFQGIDPVKRRMWAETTLDLINHMIDRQVWILDGNVDDHVIRDILLALASVVYEDCDQDYAVQTLIGFVRTLGSHILKRPREFLTVLGTMRPMYLSLLEMDVRELIEQALMRDLEEFVYIKGKPASCIILSRISKLHFVSGEVLLEMLKRILTKVSSTWRESSPEALECIVQAILSIGWMEEGRRQTQAVNALTSLQGQAG